MRVLIGSILCCVAVSGQVAPKVYSVVPTVLVNLAAEETGGIARRNEPLTAGVPLPRGIVKDTSELSLMDARAVVPAEIRPAARWLEDGSVKWVHVHFQASVPANGKRVLSLVLRKKKPGTGGPAVTDTRDSISVVTGPLKFTVRKSGFNGIGEAWLDGSFKGSFGPENQVLASHRGGLVMRAGGREYRSSQDTTGSVAIEELATSYVVIRATGTLTAKDGAKGFSYVCRLKAFAGLPRVEAQVSVANTMGPGREDFVSLERLAWEMPTAIQNPLVRFGGDRQVHEAQLTSNQSAWIYQSTSDAYELGGALSGSGKGKSSKPLTTGWASVSDARRGLAAGARWFWQMYPKSIEARGDGALLVDLYAGRAGPLDIYTGISRTHDLLFVFHEGDANLGDAFAAFQQPLRAFAVPSWYCSRTKAFGNLIEANPALFGARRDTLETYLKWWTANFEAVKQFRDGRTIKGVTRDSYGLLEFGDAFHYAWEPNKSVPRNIAWEGNYYDFPHVCLLHFLMTGRRDFFDFFIEHSRHLADVHIVHYDPNPVFIGSNRYCPPTDHVRMDPRKSSDYTTAEVYVSDTFNHHKTQSLFENYLLTGDRRALDAALMGLRYAFEYTGADAAYNQPRGPGHQMLTLLTGYEFTGDRKYLDRCRPIIEFGRKVQAKYNGAFAERAGQFFQFGIALEALVKYYGITKDESIVPMVKSAMEFLESKGRRYTNCAYAAIFLYDKTGDSKYFDYVVKAISNSEVFEHPVKNSGLAFRSTPYVLPYLASNPRK